MAGAWPGDASCQALPLPLKKQVAKQKQREEQGRAEKSRAEESRAEQGRAGGERPTTEQGERAQRNKRVGRRCPGESVSMHHQVAMPRAEYILNTVNTVILQSL